MSQKLKVWLAFGFSLVAYVYILATHEEPVCKETVFASDVPRWLSTQGLFVSYEDGMWFDGYDKLIGTSATEDSDVCVK